METLSGKFLRDSTLSSIQALSGAVFHNLNTEAGWSGSPLFREENGAHKKTAMHIAAGPPGVPLNIAVSAPSLQKQMIIKEAGDIALNCPFMQGNGVVFRQKGCASFQRTRLATNQTGRHRNMRPLRHGEQLRGQARR